MRQYIIFNTIDEMKNLTNVRLTPFKKPKINLTHNHFWVNSSLLQNNHQKDFIFKDTTRTNFICS